MRDLWEVRVLYNLVGIATSYERLESLEKGFFLTLVAGILFFKNHKNPPMEAKKLAWLRSKASSEEFELWGKS
jgi:dsRNA-specific ribonuclease